LQFKKMMTPGLKYEDFNEMPRIFLVEPIHASLALIAFYLFPEREKQTIDFLSEELQALARVPARAGADVALAGPALGRLGTPGVLRVVAPLVILAIACAAVLSWQQRQRAAEIEELDAQLLASDLPIDAYLDQGFAAWLKRRALQQP
jgi:hypothetical protein